MAMSSTPERLSLDAVVRSVRNHVRSAAESDRDRRLGIDTTAPNWTDGWDPSARNVRYEAARYKTLDVLRAQFALDPSDVVCDLGCGMGRVVCYFATLPIAGAIGVELDQALADRAARNVSEMRGRRAPARVVCADATQADLDEVTVVVMYNPFNAEVMRAVLLNLRRSLVSRPRRLRIVYINPVHGAVFDDFADLRPTMTLQVPRLGVPTWSPVKLGGDQIKVWEATPQAAASPGFEPRSFKPRLPV